MAVTLQQAAMYNELSFELCEFIGDISSPRKPDDVITRVAQAFKASFHIVFLMPLHVLYVLLPYGRPTKLEMSLI